ncbi:MAG: hypothetical protein EHM36_08190 [Deltaproteobacteria bacterium]|nr:MAG: hypothetical protein EHM36_08190 [Deltaproteobacteria bacterium]
MIGKVRRDDLVEGTEHHRVVGDQYAEQTNSVSIPYAEMIRIAKKEFLVLECWQKEYRQVSVLVNPEDDVYVSADGWSKDDISSIKTIPGFRVVKQPVTRMRMTKVCGDVLLEDDRPEEFEDYFDLIPIYAKKRKEKVWGKVEGMKDLQRELNKRRSQIADVINKVAGYGWFYDNTTFATPAMKEKFLASVSRPGFAIEVNSITSKPVKEEGVKFPSEIVQYELESSNKMREVSNINLEMLGQGQQTQSGIALAEKRRQGLIGNEFLFDNISLAKRVLGRVLVRLIQKVYTPERILRIVQNRHARNPIQVGGEEFDQVDPEVLKELLETEDLGKYDVVVS